MTDPDRLPESLQVYAGPDTRPQGICDLCGRVVTPAGRGVEVTDPDDGLAVLAAVMVLYATRCPVCHQAARP